MGNVATAGKWDNTRHRKSFKAWQNRSIGIQTLPGQVSDQHLEAPPSRTRSPEQVQQSLDAFALHLQGVSYRGILNHIGWKAFATAQNAVRHGEGVTKKLNLDGQKIRFKPLIAFNYLVNIVVDQVKQQIEQGQLQAIDGPDCRVTKATHGVDPRLLDEVGRGLIRFAEFTGLMNRVPEVYQQVVSMVNLALPSDGGDCI